MVDKCDTVTSAQNQQVINVEKSAVKIHGTKVEIILHKADGMKWADLKYKHPSN